MEHFKANRARILSNCMRPKSWVRAGGCWKAVFWNKKKQFIVQQRCNLRCGRRPMPVNATKPIVAKPPKEDVPITSLPTKPSDVPTGSAPPLSKIKFVDDKYKQTAEFLFDRSFRSPTLDFDDTYNRAELLNGGSAKVCSKNYNEQCKGTNDKCMYAHYGLLCGSE